MTAGHTEHDYVYHACIDYICAYEAGVETDESIERLRAELPPDETVAGIIRELLSALESATGMARNSSAEDRAEAWLAEKGE